MGVSFFHPLKLITIQTAERMISKGRKTRKMPKKKSTKLIVGGLVDTPMRRSYGEMILQKGTILYHSSKDSFCTRPDKPMLFSTFHPMDWPSAGTTGHITKIILKKDVSLFFMIDKFNRAQVLPLLQKLTSGGNLVKQHDHKLVCFVKYLFRERFNGWISTTEGGVV